VCRVTLCVYCWGHFVNIAKMYGNLFSGRPSSLALVLTKKSVLILVLGPEVLALVLVLKFRVLVLVLTKKSYLHHWIEVPQSSPKSA